jgi:xanthine dehydrogenase accessory factor
MPLDLFDHMYELSRAGESFAVATVVRVEKPISAKPGDKGIIKPDGTLEGWIGGGCAQDTVIREAKKAIRDGQSRLLRLVGKGTIAETSDGVIEFPITCHSGGTLDVYIEPMLPRPQLILLGNSPVAITLAKLVKVIGWQVDVQDMTATREQFPNADSISNEINLISIPHRPIAFIVIATQGHDDEPALEAAARYGAPYVAFVASKKKFASRIGYLRARGLSDEQIMHIKAPAGLDIGAVTPDEIAGSILAEMIQMRRQHWMAQAVQVAEAVAAAESIVAEARDPICGMMVETATARYVSQRNGETYYFCSFACKEQFEQFTVASGH